MTISIPWTTATCCGFPVRSLLWKTAFNLNELQGCWFRQQAAGTKNSGSRLPERKRQQAAAVQSGRAFFKESSWPIAANGPLEQWPCVSAQRVTQ